MRHNLRILLLIPATLIATYVGAKLLLPVAPVGEYVTPNFMTGCDTVENADLNERAAKNHDHDARFKMAGVQCITVLPGGRIFIEETTATGRVRFRKPGDIRLYWTASRI